MEGGSSASYSGPHRRTLGFGVDKGNKGVNEEGSLGTERGAGIREVARFEEEILVKYHFKLFLGMEFKETILRY